MPNNIQVSTKAYPVVGVLLLIATLLIAGCSTKRDNPIQLGDERLRGAGVLSARAVISPFTIRAKENKIDIEVDRPPGPPVADLPVTVFCADWVNNNFVNKTEGGAIWKAKSRYVIVTMPEKITDRQACGMNWTTGQSADDGGTETTIVGFFNPDEGKSYIIEEQKKFDQRRQRSDLRR